MLIGSVPEENLGEGGQRFFHKGVESDLRGVHTASCGAAVSVSVWDSGVPMCVHKFSISWDVRIEYTAIVWGIIKIIRFKVKPSTWKAIFSQ